jgi:hypothetical protein
VVGARELSARSVALRSAAGQRSLPVADAIADVAAACAAPI